VFKHILVPIDLSRRNTSALSAAADLARDRGTRVTVLHVIARIEHVPAEELRSFYRQLEGRAQRELARAARQLTRKGISVRGTVVIGAPAEEIVRYAAANKVDLILMRSHPIGRGRGEGWGTTSYKVAVLCTCPVLLVK
jgi:nucleotide-binding universal stress UspA family protein